MTTTERTEFDADAAAAIPRKACEVAQVDPDGIEMLRFGERTRAHARWVNYSGGFIN